MTGEKIKEATALYRALLDEYGYGPQEALHEEYIAHQRSNSAIKHVRTMLDKIDTFVDEGRVDKAFRWLGFAQGVLWTDSFYTLDELKNHNRP